MMKRRIFLWMGLIVLFLSFGLSREALAKEVAYKVKRGDSYIVKKGDNLYGIARKTGFSVSEIKEANNLHSNNLKIGQKIILSKKAADTGGEKTAKSAGKSTELADSEE